MLRAKSRLKLSTCPPKFSLSRCASTSRSPVDFYSQLGISRNATAKEVKTAFYELSKKYHPDVNPEDREGAAVKFQDIVQAYEVLSHTEKRKAYDLETAPRRPGVHSATLRRQTAEMERRRQKQYTDLDIDYKDLEHFQRTANRRRNLYREHLHYNEELLRQNDNYRSNLASEREKEERRLREELERERAESRYKTPTFEQLLQEKSKQRNKHQRKTLIRSFGFMIMLGTFLFLATSARR
ncbi:J domain-containing protein [Aphelenchoides besseyi]|nr:J domain-containing protein [Aphelenchoides besseyi]KAI6210012.1 J domain-containing protein [Aphelenchoides besseyi]